MKIRVSEIPDEGIDINEEETISAGTDGLAQKAALSLRIEKIDSEVLLRGSIAAKLSLVCSRCLKGFMRDVAIPVSVEYRPVEELGAEEKSELGPDELNTGFYKNDELDLNEISREQVLLNVPMKPLCREDCKGICPECGADLNDAACECGAFESDSRFEKLKEYFTKERRS